MTPNPSTEEVVGRLREQPKSGFLRLVDQRDLDTAADEIERLTAREKALVDMLTECASDLEAEIKGRASGELPRRIARDMDIVARSRALLLPVAEGPR